MRKLIVGLAAASLVAGIGRVAKSKGYFTVEGSLADADGALRDGFSCTIRNGTIYGFRSTAEEA